jgi:hypothetical protein
VLSYQSTKASPPKIMVKNSDGSSVPLLAFCNHYYTTCISIPNPLLGIAPSLPYLSYAARSWSSLSIWYASPICHPVSPAILVEYRTGSPYPLLMSKSTYFLELRVCCLIARVLVCVGISP